MNILYIHGLDSSPNPERMNLLESHGHQLFALHIDYRNEENIYSKLVSYAKENAIQYIVGSSLGGYLGYWIGQDLGIPQLVFNPALAMRSIAMDAPYTITERDDLLTRVVLGVKDDRVPHDGNVDFFRTRPWARVISCHWMEHQIDFQTFKESMDWAGLAEN